MVGYHILIAFDESFNDDFWKGFFNLAEGGTQSLFFGVQKNFPKEKENYIYAIGMGIQYH